VDDDRLRNKEAEVREEGEEEEATDEVHVAIVEASIWMIIKIDGRKRESER
jgi:hypothetical protein